MIIQYRFKMLVSIFLLLILSSCSFFKASPKVAEVRRPEKEGIIENIEISEMPDRIRVNIKSSEPIIYTAFQIGNPPRFIVDLTETASGNFKSEIIIAKGGVKKLVPTEARGEIVVSRLDVYLDKEMETDITGDGHNLYVDFFEKGTKSALAAENAGVAEAVLKPEGNRPETEDNQEADTKITYEVNTAEKDGKIAETVEKKDPAKKPAEKKEAVPEASQAADTAKTSPSTDTIKEGEIDLRNVKATLVSDIVVDEKGFKVSIRGDGRMEPKVFTLGDKRIVIDIPDVDGKLPTKMLNVHKYIERIRVGQHKDPKKLRIVMDVPAVLPYEVTANGREIVLTMKEGAAEGSTGYIGTADSAVEEEETAGETPAKEAVHNPAELKKEQEKTGAIDFIKAGSVQINGDALIIDGDFNKKVSFNLQDADVTNVLRLIAEVMSQNIVISEDVEGTLTLKVEEVAGIQVFETILNMKRLGVTYNDGIMIVDTLENINKMQDEKSRVAETKLKAEDLVTKIVYVNYANVKDITETTRKNLSKRGDISFDIRTNALIITDIKKNVEVVSELIKHLDRKTTQVLIEARIVQVVPEFNRTLGVKWGASFADMRSNNIMNVGTGNIDNASFGTLTPDFGINLPAGALFGDSPMPSAGFTFGRFTENPFSLDLRLSAGELEGLTKIVSTPKITVLDNQSAKIEQGESIPYATTSQEGTTTIFVDANLSLDVTPHITSDGYITLKIKAAKNAPGSVVTDAGPSIEKREAATTVIIKDKETIVIGGIYETTKNESKQLVPGLARIPILGALFRNESVSSKTKELLVFLTPTILE